MVLLKHFESESQVRPSPILPVNTAQSSLMAARNGGHHLCLVDSYGRRENDSLSTVQMRTVKSMASHRSTQSMLDSVEFCHLEYLLAIYEGNNFTEAAERVYRSQAAISQ